MPQKSKQPGKAKRKEDNADKKNSPFPLFAAIITAIAMIMVPIISKWNPLPAYICPFHGQTDEETIVNLIEAEAQAVNSKDLKTILKIFGRNGAFYDYAVSPPKYWNGPLTRYRDDLFRTTEFQGVEHFDVLPAGSGIEGNIAYYTSGSKGSYRIGEGTRQNFFNGSLISTPFTQYGSEHWLLKRNIVGCWTIVQMDFNAGHIEFP